MSLWSAFRRKRSRDYLRQQVERSWRHESDALQRLGLADGMSIADIGCGPGHFTEKLVEWLPHAAITAIDHDPKMRAAARQRLGARVTIVDAAADATGLAASSIDVVIARLLFQHLRDPLAVAREAHRVLRPGGTFVAIDIDDDRFGVVEPPLPELARVLAHFGAMQSARGGDRRVARSLDGYLRNAGFASVATDTIAIDSGEAGLEACLPQLDAAPLQALLDAGRISERERDELRAARERFFATPGARVVLQMFVAHGVKR